MKRHASMNRIYRLVWSHAQNTWIAVSENAKGQGKLGAKRKLIVTALSLAFSPFVQAAPIGGQIGSGMGNISQSGPTTTITQSSQNLSINWQSFNIAKQETVNFLQPSTAAIAVNRIYDTNGTQILGHLNANGQVFLINPNGILFGQGAQVNVGGLVASTLDMNDGSLNSSARTFSGNGKGSIVNQGAILADDGGYVALLGNTVSNQGSITARLGTVALGAGSAATLTFSGNSLIHLQVDQSTLNNLAENKQLIQADGGQVLMSAGAKNALLASVVNNTGVVEARTVENRNGTIILLGGMQAGTATVGGTLDASASSGGNGGFIETSAAHVNVANDTQVITAASMGLAGTWLIDPVDFTIAASGGDITGATLSANLGGGNVNILSSSGTTGVNGDVNVNDVVTWSANKLTLNAQRNININANLNGSGTASLALEYGQGAVALNNTSDYFLNNGAQVNLPAGNHFSTKLGSNGSVNSYTVITSLGAEGSTTGTDLQGMNGNLAANYTLGANIDATATATWNAGAGFTPMDPRTRFTGTFDGLGHTISNLTIYRRTTDYAGLFGVIDTGSTVRNVGLIGGSTYGKSYVGGLAGSNFGTISNSYNTGSVSGWAAGTYGIVGGLVGSNSGGTISNSHTTGNVSAPNSVGGLVGINRNNSTISNSYATGNVASVNSASIYGNVGGLVGQNISGSNINNSHATGSTNGNTNNNTGGLVGNNSNGNISNSYATGNVDGGSYAGGLVAYLYNGTVSNSYATGNVSGVTSVGGLVGYAWYGTISNSHATGGVTGTTVYIGGLLGSANPSAVSNSYATGNVSGWKYVGGLAGQAQYGTISNSYATGNATASSFAGGLIGSLETGETVSSSHASGIVTGGDRAGGLAGRSMGTISNSYAVGAVSGSTYVGGLVGANTGMISNSYATGNVIGTGNSVGGLAGQSGNSPISNSYATGNVASTGDNVGGLVGIGGSAISNSYATGSVSGANNVGGLVGRDGSGGISNSYATGSATASTNYNYVGGLVGFNYLGNISNSYSTGAVSVSSSAGGLVGGIVYGTVSNSFWNTTTSGQTTSAGGTGLSSTQMQQMASFTGWDIANTGGSTATWRIYEGQTAPLLRSLLVPFTVSNGSKIYDGQVAGSSAFAPASNVFGSLSYGGGAVGAINVGSYSVTNLSGLYSNQQGYDFSYANGTLTINQRPVNLTGSRVYDGTTAVSSGIFTLGNLVSGETLTLSGAGSVTSKNVSAGNQAVALGTLALSNGSGLASNYTFTGGTQTASFTPAALTISGITASNKVYDGTTAATVNTASAIYTGLIAGDLVTVSATGAFVNPNIGTGITVLLTSSYTGTDVSNYVITGQASTTADITP